ncbi:PREDICTED: hippocampus abundant transcript 1 protein [Dipodomys ordii]|uniref:Hippocampus abundant transcript 1 protein n=1 Tax=Dipodomys ordii TaxID=10020 RepID=A0A1S3GDF0_DIPOR|nr:PREDICTED: hippocampus abundant transcript 1 protein [Dipodomys ordii]
MKNRPRGRGEPARPHRAPGALAPAPERPDPPSLPVARASRAGSGTHLCTAALPFRPPGEENFSEQVSPSVRGSVADPTAPNCGEKPAVSPSTELQGGPRRAAPHARTRRSLRVSSRGPDRRRSRSHMLRTGWQLAPRHARLRRPRHRGRGLPFAAVRVADPVRPALSSAPGVGSGRETAVGGGRLHRPQGIGSPSVYHAVIVIFLEFFAWGLLTAPTLVVLHETFPKHTFLMNGLIQGVKGLLSFLSAPLIGALSDVWGRKSFLLLTVFFTCAPIPLMKISPCWLQVSATFAASLVTSPAIGAYLGRVYGDSLVVVLATAIALLDICFILVAVPESLPEKMRPASWGAPISWEQADPFASLKKVGQDSIVLLICITVFLSYLPEAGQYSSFFLYLRQIMKFSPESVAAFIAVLGILSIIAQTIVLSLLMRSIGNKNTILLGLGFQILQLAWYGFGSEPWMMWAAGAVAAMSSITFPAVSALVSRTADADQQGVVQGMITGIRGLCNGLGPALYGFIFYIFHVELKELPITGTDLGTNTSPQHHFEQNSIIPGPPFLFGACSVLLALLVALFIPEHTNLSLRSSSWRKHCGSHSHPHSTQAPGEAKEPLLQDTNV